MDPHAIMTMWIGELIALFLSCLIEGPVSYTIGRISKWDCRGPRYMGWASVWATCITHPQMWYMVKYLEPKWGYWPMFWFLEAIVVLAEGLLIAWMAGLRRDRAMLASLVANSASAFFGVFLEFLLKGHVG